MPKALNSHYFILKVPWFLKCFGSPPMTTILLWDQFHHIFYQDCVKKTVLMIFQFMFVQDSKMLLIPKVQTIVKLFLDMTSCVQFLKIISTCDNTGKGWLHQKLQPEVWIYAARIIWTFFIPLTVVIWLKFYTHLKIIFNGVYPSHLPVTRENI